MSSAAPWKRCIFARAARDPGGQGLCLTGAVPGRRAGGPAPPRTPAPSPRSPRRGAAATAARSGQPQPGLAPGLRKVRLGGAGKRSSRWLLRKYPARARPALLPAPTAGSARPAAPAAPPGQAGAYAPHGLCPGKRRQLESETSAAARAQRHACSLGQKHSHQPEAAQGLSDSGFKRRQPPKTRGGERHSRDDENTAQHTCLPLHGSRRSTALTLDDLNTLDISKKSLNETAFSPVSFVLNAQSNISYFLKANCIQVPVLIHPFCLGGIICHRLRNPGSVVSQFSKVRQNLSAKLLTH